MHLSQIFTWRLFMAAWACISIRVIAVLEIPYSCADKTSEYISRMVKIDAK